MAPNRQSILKRFTRFTRNSLQGICDGAGALVLASEEAVKQNNLTPIARLLGYSAVGVDPTIMGFGPVPAIQNVLKVCGKSLNDIDLIEVNKNVVS